jgi:hypothetical protein
MAIKIAGVDVINDDRELVLAKLTEINESINDTAVDVFIYDTSKDSDGGAWRHRTQHTSWYAEASSASRDPNTRSTRAEFPAVAVIVAEASKVTIYDGDDPSLPMWMVFTYAYNNMLVGDAAQGGPFTSAFAINGQVVVGNGDGTAFDAGLAVVSFVSDSALRYRVNTIAGIQGNYLGNIAERNDVKGWSGYVSQGVITSDRVNDVAMTVLPDAPTDPATGLPVPTIACLVAETEVLMADGSTKRLDQVQPGAMVKTLEGEHRVLNWWDQGIKDVIELEFEGRHKITCTADHKIRTTTGWVEAGDLTEDHEVVVA